DHDTRLHRLVATRGMDVADAKARIAAQATDEQRREAADWIIDNSGTVAETQTQVDAVWAKLAR
ncbi:dephospho-CoA kinase, partial [Acinetobacter baumannii]|uniref:dephospho-CoA kinase n=1 Tax=Acinetobacter baumannii TaxID=470 RepID=UPI001897BB2A